MNTSSARPWSVYARAAVETFTSSRRGVSTYRVLQSRNHGEFPPVKTPLSMWCIENCWRHVREEKGEKRAFSILVNDQNNRFIFAEKSKYAYTRRNVIRWMRNAAALYAHAPFLFRTRRRRLYTREEEKQDFEKEERERKRVWQYWSAKRSTKAQKTF